MIGLIQILKKLIRVCWSIVIKKNVRKSPEYSRLKSADQIDKKVDSGLLYILRNIAVKESQAAKKGTTAAPIIVDECKASNQFGICLEQIKELNKMITNGSQFNFQFEPPDFLSESKLLYLYTTEIHSTIRQENNKTNGNIPMESLKGFNVIFNCTFPKK
jgi:hypothetical protein